MTPVKRNRDAPVGRSWGQAPLELDRLIPYIAERVVDELGAAMCGVAWHRSAEPEGDDLLSSSAGEVATPFILDRDPASMRALQVALSFPEGQRAAAALARTIAEGIDPVAIPSLSAPRASSPERGGGGERDAFLRSTSWEARPFTAWLERFAIHSLLAAPLRAGELTLGALVCVRRGTTAPFSAADAARFQEIVDRASLALENARLRAELRGARHATDLLRGLSSSVARAGTVDDILEPALRAMSEQLRTERCGVALFDGKAGPLRFSPTSRLGLSPESLTALAGSSLLQEGSDERPPGARVWRDISELPEWKALPRLAEPEGSGGVALIPLVNNNACLGYFLARACDATQSFRPEDVSAGQDIADQVAASIAERQSRAERERLIEELTRTVELNEVFIGILGHDLRNPLGAVLMSATILSRKLTDETLNRTVGRILSAGERMNRMIAQLIDFTRVRASGSLAIDSARCDAAILFQQSIAEVREPSLGGRTVAFSHRGDTQGWWDPERLAQVASSLVGNAMGHGAPDGEVQVVVNGDAPDAVVIEVRNAGSIPTDQLRLVFEPFQSGEARDRRRGLGLDLFISRAIVAAHGGVLSVACSEESTTFEVRLPRRAAALP